MGEALVQFGGLPGELMLWAYLIGGLAAFMAAFLPGNSALYRVVCLMLGTAMAAWAAEVLMFGGSVYRNPLVLLAPLVLLGRGAIGTVRHVVTSPGPRPGMRPHPAARQFGGAGSYRMHPPAAYRGGYRPDPYATVPPADEAEEPTYARAVFGTEPAHLPAGRPGAHAAQPTGHIPRQPGVRTLPAPDAYAGRARHRAN